MSDKELTLKELEYFKTLPKGWHYGEGEAFTNQEVFEVAEELVNLAHNNRYDTGAFPGFYGNVMITFYKGELSSGILSYDFDIKSRENIDFCLEYDMENINGKRIYEELDCKEKITFDDVKDIIKKNYIIINIDECEKYMHPLQFKLELGVSLDTFNIWCCVPEIEFLTDNEEFYLPPAPTLDYIDNEALHAALIKINKINENCICFYFEEFGHLIGD